MNFLNKILFEEKIKKLKSESVRNYFLTFLSVKQILTKLILFLMISFVIITISFTTRQFALNNWSDKVVLNPGIAFSGISELKPEIVMVVQGVPVFIALIGFIFINNQILYIPLIFMSIGGMCNFIDRFIDDPNQIKPSVVDYIHIKGSIINFPDIIVVTSSVIFGVNCLICVIFYIKKENKKEANKLNKTESSIENKKTNI